MSIRSAIWSHIRSPVSARALAFFFVGGFILYMLISDWQRRQASYERDQAIAASRQEIVQTLETTRQYAVLADQSIANTTAMLGHFENLSTSVREMAEILKNASAERQRQQRRSGRRVRRSRPQQECFEEVERTETHGEVEVIIRELRKKPCDPD